MVNGFNRELHISKCEYRETFGPFDKTLNMSVKEEETNGKSNNSQFNKKFTYSCKLLREGLLDMACVDARQEGDGIKT